MSTPEPRWDGPPLEAWSGAWTPWEAAAALEGVGVPWCVVGGWSIDLFLGEVTRQHEDIEIEVLRRDHLVVREHLAPLSFRAVGDGEIRVLEPGEVLPAELHQSWALDEAAQLWRVDVMLEDGDDETWTCRRSERITAPRAEIVTRTADGVPYLRPQASLLYKAKGARAKDVADLDATLPRLDDDATRWLEGALEVAHPGHPWLERL